MASRHRTLPTKPRDREGGVRRTARSALAVAGLSIVFTGSFATALVLHAQLPASRRLAVRVVLRELNRVMAGSIEIDSIDGLSPYGLKAVGVTVREPGGRPVMFASRLEATYNLRKLAASVLLGSGDVQIAIPWVRADQVDLELFTDTDGRLTLEHAFMAPPRPPVVPPAVPTKPGRRVIVDLQQVEVGMAQARGYLVPLGPIDADANKVRGSVHVGPDGVRVDTQDSSIVARGLLARTATGIVQVHVHAPGAVWGHFSGSIGNVELTGFAKLQGRDLDVTADVPHATAQDFSQLVPGLKVNQDVRARVTAHGTLPMLDTSISVELGSGRIDARGPLITSDPVRADMTLRVRNLDVRALSEQAPATHLSFDGTIDASMADAKPRVHAAGMLEPTTIGGVQVAATDVDAALDAQGARGQLRIFEPGMPIDAQFTYAPESELRVKATTRIASLQAAPRLHHAAAGSASASVDARLRGSNLDAVATADLDRVARPGASVQHAHLVAHAWGKIPELSVDAQVTGQGLDMGGLSWKQASVGLHGPWRAPQLRVELRDEDAPNVTTTAGLRIGNQVGAHDIHVEVARGDQRFAIQAESVDVSAAAIDLGGIAVDGLGSPVDGVVRLGPNGFDVRLFSKGIDLQKLSRVLGLPGHNISGTAAVDIDVRNAGAQSDGCMRLDIRGAHVDFVSGIELSARARLAGTHVELDANAAVGAESSSPGPEASAGGACLPAQAVSKDAMLLASAGADLGLNGSPLHPGSWREASGTATLHEAMLDLDKIGALAHIVRRAVPNLNIPELAGKLRVIGALERDNPKAAPSWSMGLSTEHLSITTGTGGDERKIQGADLSLAASMQADGALRSMACVYKDVLPARPGACDLRDRPIVGVELGSSVDWSGLLANASRWRQILGDAPTRVRVVVPERSVSAMAEPFLSGHVLPADARRASAVLDMSGTFSAPRFELQAVVERPTLAQETLPALVCLTGSYDGKTGSATALLRRAGEAAGRVGALPACGPARQTPGARDIPQDVGLVLGIVKLDWSEVLRARSLSGVAWDGSINFKIDNLDLREVPEFAASDVSGLLSGSGGITGLGQSPEFQFHINVDRLRIGEELASDQATFSLYSGPRGIVGSADITAKQPDKRTVRWGASADLRSERPLQWRDGLIPELPELQPVSVRAHTLGEGLPAGVLLPLTQPVLSYLDGRLTGYVNGTYVRGGDHDLSRIDDVYIAFTRGAFQIPLVGQEFIDASAVVRTTSPNQLVI